MFFAQFLDDFGAGGGLVAERLAADARSNSSINSCGKAVRVNGKRLVSQMPAISQCPVVVSFPGETVAPLPKAAFGPRGGVQMRRAA